MTYTTESTHACRVPAAALLAAAGAAAWALAGCGATPTPASSAAGGHVTTGAGVVPVDTGAPGAAGLIAQDQSRWLMVGFHGCRPTDWGKQATTFARQLSAAIAVGHITA